MTNLYFTINNEELKIHIELIRII